MAEKKSNLSASERYLKVSRPHDTCLLCEEPLNIDGKHPTMIQMEDTAEEVIRKDFCAKCWQKMHDEGYFSFWITKRANAPSAAERRLARSERNEALWRLFSALSSSSEAENLAPQLFLLAHLLMRYKVLIYTGKKEGVLLFQHPKLGETFEVPDLAYEEIDFSEINKQIEEQAIDFAPSNQPSGEQDDRAPTEPVPDEDAEEK